MVPQCVWRDNCEAAAVWMVSEGLDASSRFAPSCDAHFADTVREKVVEWLGCWVDKA